MRGPQKIIQNTIDLKQVILAEVSDLFLDPQLSLSGHSASLRRLFAKTGVNWCNGDFSPTIHTLAFATYNSCMARIWKRLSIQ